MMKLQNCFSGSSQWSPAWQAKMNAKGHRASLTLIKEYPELKLVEMSAHQKGYDVQPLEYDIFIDCIFSVRIYLFIIIPTCNIKIYIRITLSHT